METSILKQELENAALLIQVQNFPESTQEYDKERIMTWLIEETELEGDWLRDEVEAI